MIKKIEDNLVSIAVAILIIPVLIFCFGFLKLYIAIGMSVIILFAYYRLIKSVVKVEEVKEAKEPPKSGNGKKKKSVEKTNTTDIKKTLIYYGVVLVVILVWVGFSGIGDFAYQNSDWVVRNAVFRDLVDYDWPVEYDFSGTSPEVASVIGVDSARFVYYFAFWLVPALFGKIFGYRVATIVLFIWTSLILLVIVGLINRKLGKNSFITLIVLIVFSGMDILKLDNIFRNIFTQDHIEWQSMYIQYSANTTQLYWVFNQCVMVWLIAALLLSIKNPESIIFVSCMTFCYSPFATFGVIPIAVCLLFLNLFREKNPNIIKRLAKVAFSVETLCALGILIIFGTYYVSADTSISDRGFTWIVNGLGFGEFFKIWLKFILTEFLLFIVVLFKDYKKDVLFWVIALELLLIPFYKMTHANDFCMRASMAPMFLLMIYVIEYLVKSKSKWGITLMTCLLVVGTVTPLHEVYRSVYQTFNNHDYIIRNEMIYSVGNPSTVEGAVLCNEQFYSKDYENKFFYKYLSK